ncbi:hypothetical protein ACIDE9_03200 [Methylophilus sp. 'Pure River']|uniref:hypothetical protein n=1 Tax=Methylophilus sp. 'Pure River' TaxID=3377117 RepID=UPI00398F8777
MMVTDNYNNGLLRDSKTPLVIDGKLKALPIDSELSWEDFERLIVRLVRYSLSGTIQNSFQYGRQGQKQYGIDIVAFNAATADTFVLQCKHVKTISRGDITKWIREFLTGERRKGVSKYFLCTSFSIETDTALVDEWKEAAFSLFEEKIDSALWDYGELQSLLRYAEPVVLELFGEAAAERFCVRLEPNQPTEYPVNYRQKFAHRLDSSLIFENLTCRLDLLVPNDKQQIVSALLSFARKDLNGITLGIDSDELMHWLQWRAHAQEIDSRPYAIPTDNKERWMLSTKHARLTLSTDELSHLDWILKEAWNRLLPVIFANEAKWQTMRFKLIEHNYNRDSYALVSVHRNLWSIILDFAWEYDFANGDSNWHIFDAAPGMLKVYVRNRRARLEPGYHLMMQAHNEVGVAGPWDENVVLSWTPLSDFDDQAEAVGPTKAWDAEYTHHWIIERLIPTVIEWHQNKRMANNRWVSFKTRDVKKGSSSALGSSDLCYSLAQCGSRELGRNINDTTAIRCAVSQMQSHFNGGHKDVPVDIALTRAVLKLSKRILPFVSLPDEHYIRGKLPLNPKLALADGLEVLASSDQVMATRQWLDLSLRCLSAIIDDVDELPPSELGHAIDELIPIWRQLKEDLLCSVFRQ